MADIENQQPPKADDFLTALESANDAVKALGEAYKTGDEKTILEATRVLKGATAETRKHIAEITRIKLYSTSD